MPRCGHCKTQNVECMFPTRKKRKPASVLSDQATSSLSDSALSTILKRLHRLEAQSTLSPTPIANACALSPTTSHANPDSNSSSPSTASVLASHGSPSAIAHHARQEFDAMTVLKDAVDQVQQLRLRSFGSAVITDSISIPADVAVKYVHSKFAHSSFLVARQANWVCSDFFAHGPVCLFSNIVDKRVLELIPSIIGLPHIHIDPVMLVIYYSIIYHGCTLIASNNSSSDRMEYFNASYLGCLRALPGWQREASGSLMDFVAALFVVSEQSSQCQSCSSDPCTQSRVAAEFFDYDLAWKMFKLACDYCQGLNIHNLDGDDAPCGGDPAQCDQERRGFWEVIQIDLFFRLVLNAPPAISNNPWKVNLPWLDPNAGPPPDGIASMSFLASSRISLIIARFFAMLDGSADTNRSEIMVKNEDLCREIQDTLAEWPLVSWVQYACIEKYSANSVTGGMAGKYFRQRTRYVASGRCHINSLHKHHLHVPKNGRPGLDFTPASHHRP